MLSCMECQDGIFNYLYDVCEDEERPRISTHLESCVECRTELAQAVEDLSLITDAAKLEVPDFEFEPPEDEAEPEPVTCRRPILQWVPALTFFINPRSAVYRITQSVQAVPWFVLSVGLHAAAAILLLQVDFGHAREPVQDLILDTRVIDPEEVDFVDPNEFRDKLKDLMDAEHDLPEEKIEPSTIPNAPPSESIPQEDPAVDKTLEEEGSPGDGQLEAELAIENALALGEDEWMVTVGSVFEGSPNGKVTSYGLRKSEAKKRNALRAHGGSKLTENAARDGLAFLAKYQQPAGHWSSATENFDKGMEGPNDVAVTGLSLLAFLGAGHTETHGKHKDVVRKAVNYLRRVQGSDGSWMYGGRMYGHGICTMAMSEAYGLVGERSRAGHAAQAGVRFIVKNQGDNGGFGYTGPGQDTSVTGWQVMACKSAIMSGLGVPNDTIARFEKFLDAKMDPATGVTGYRERGTGSDAMTSVGLVCRLFLDQDPKETPVLVKAADRIMKAGPSVNDVYYLYYGTLGIFQMGGERWKEWNGKFAMETVARQLKRGRFAGSWDWRGVRHGERGGSIYVTSMYLLCLEVYYRYLPLYK